MLIYIIEYLPNYRKKAINELKTLSQKEIDPAFIVLVKSLEKKLPEEYQDLKESFSKLKKVSEIWDQT